MVESKWLKPCLSWGLGPNRYIYIYIEPITKNPWRMGDRAMLSDFSYWGTRKLLNPHN